MDWENKGVGEVVSILASAEAPAKDQAYRFIKLAAGESFLGGYNEGVITGETVSGSYPNVTATGVISEVSSPFNGQTVDLISTEGQTFLNSFARIL
jgi:hypothetical protein